jgi:uncharacterized Fe-S cluster protein YjdI
MKEVTKEYINGEATVVWQNKLCTHSANCARGLPEVFNARENPWIKPENAATEKLMEQVKKCPSGALSFYRNG